MFDVLCIGRVSIDIYPLQTGVGLDVATVPEQREPNGEFPTVAFPNPEEAAALKMALDLGAKLKADCVMATDPDADRLGIAVPGMARIINTFGGTGIVTNEARDEVKATLPPDATRWGHAARVIQTTV